MKNWDIKTLHSFILSICLLMLCGCAMLVVESNPPGATVFYATNPVGPWKTWQRSRQEAITPLRKLGFFADFYFIKIMKDGYYPPQPELVELYPFQARKVKFWLKPTPELFAAQQRAKGLILYKDEWVDPVEKNLVNYKGEWITPAEQFALEQRERGLVEYQGRWMTPEEKAVLYAKEQEARGLVLYKNRWLTLQEKETEERIDNEVRKLVEGKSSELDPAKIVGTIGGRRARLRLFNGTGEKMGFLISGSHSTLSKIDPYDTDSIDLRPGEYVVVAREEKEDSVPYIRREIFQEGFQYSITYHGEPLVSISSKLDLDQLREAFKLPEVKLPELETAEETTPSLKLIEELKQKFPSLTTEQLKKMQERMKSLTPEQRKKMQERMKSLTPEQLKGMQERMKPPMPGQRNRVRKKGERTDTPDSPKEGEVKVTRQLDSSLQE